MRSVETRPQAGVPPQELTTESNVGTWIRVSRKNVNSFKGYLVQREELLRSCGETEGEIELYGSLIKRINTCLKIRGNDKSDSVALILKAQDIERFGSILIKHGVRLPPLMKAVVQIADAIGVNSRTNLSEVKSYCFGVLKEVESMPH